MSSLYTFMLEFRGGFYISQYRGRSPREALRRWVKGESRTLTGQWHPKIVDTLFANFLTENPIAYEGAVHVWHARTSVGNEHALVQIVATKEA